MSVSTIDEDGFPQSRIVLLKSISERGFEFFTNTESAKARDIAARPQVSALFFWPQLERQIRFYGNCIELSRERAMAYFHSRPRKSQISAWCSPQSHVVDNRQQLEASWQKYENKFADGEIPLPDFWGGYCIEPIAFEFWQGRASRLHDRIVYTKNAGDWVKSRLAP